MEGRGRSFLLRYNWAVCSLVCWLSGGSLYFSFFINQKGNWCLSNINCSMWLYTKVFVDLETV